MEKGVILQYFEWYTPSEPHLWVELKENAKKLKEAGFSAIWMPPSYKGIAGKNDVGYGAYDLYDLGE
ncbi:MAG TPA: alpha-amylase, partial [Erysipelotrichaceae bacterium]|nr:alpha-amylase [Erysipelotrichaceae bacterium]